MNIDWSIVVPAVVAALVSLVGTATAYKLASKKASGNVSTTTADRLWDESSDFRRDLLKRLVLADKRADELERDVLVLEETVRGLNRRVRDLRALLKTHDITALNGENGNGA